MTSKENSTAVISEHLLLLLHATRLYIMNRTPNSEDKTCYGIGNGTCREIMSMPLYKNIDFNILIDRLMESRLQGLKIRQSWWQASTPRSHYELAHDHAIEIVRSLAKRFVTGVSSESKTVHREVDTHSKPKVY